MAFDGLELIEPNALYNLLQQATVYSCLSDPNYLLLIDSRIKSEYNESHVVTAKKAPKSEGGSFMVPYDAELECKQHIIVYDSNTSELSDVEAPGIACGRLLWEMGSRNPVKILRGGYEEFSALYPFLRTQKILFMPREMDQIKTYPVEIVPGTLYVGSWRQGNAPYIQKDLKVKAHINVCLEAETFFKDPGPEHLHLQVDDSNDADLLPHFDKACSFINEHRQKKEVVLVFDYLGISRCAAIVIAYLMKHNQWPLMEAYFHVQKCLTTLRPNRAFVQQLSDWENQLFGARATDIADPNF